MSRGKLKERSGEMTKSQTGRYAKHAEEVKLKQVLIKLISCLNAATDRDQ